MINVSHFAVTVCTSIRKKYKIKYLHDINPKPEQIMRHEMGVYTVCKVFLRQVLSLWAASVVLFFTLAQQVQSNHEAATLCLGLCSLMFKVPFVLLMPSV